MRSAIAAAAAILRLSLLLIVVFSFVLGSEKIKRVPLRLNLHNFLLLLFLVIRRLLVRTRSFMELTNASEHACRGPLRHHNLCIF